jgi:hypothetical protein
VGIEFYEENNGKDLYYKLTLDEQMDGKLHLTMQLSSK